MGRRKMVTRICPQCGQLLTYRAEQTYCSRKCVAASRRVSKEHKRLVARRSWWRWRDRHGEEARLKINACTLRSYHRHRERILAKTRERRRKNGAFNKWQQTYRAKNRERLRAIAREYERRRRRLNPEKYRKLKNKSAATLRDKLRTLGLKKPAPIKRTVEDRKRLAREREKQYWLAHPERAREISRESARRSRQRFPQRHKEANQRYRLRNPDAIKQRRINWRARNIEKVRAYQRKVKSADYQIDIVLRGIDRLDIEMQQRSQ